MHPCTGADPGNMSAMSGAEPSAPDTQVFDLGPRSAWLCLTVALTLLILAQTVAFTYLCSCLLPDLVSWICVVAVGVPSVALLLGIGSALFARITVDADYLQIKFGLLGGTRIRRGDIAAAERFTPLTIRPIGLGIYVPAGSRQMSASRGGPVRYVRILLDRPVTVRMAPWRRAEANELVVGTGRPDRLLVALGCPVPG